MMQLIFTLKTTMDLIFHTKKKNKRKQHNNNNNYNNKEILLTKNNLLSITITQILKVVIMVVFILQIIDLFKDHKVVNQVINLQFQINTQDMGTANKKTKLKMTKITDLLTLMKIKIFIIKAVIQDTASSIIMGDLLLLVQIKTENSMFLVLIILKMI